MNKHHRDLLKMLRPIAKAEGVDIGTFEPGGKHLQLPCRRADGTEFRLTVSVSPNGRHQMAQVRLDFLRHAKNNGRGVL